MNVQVVLGFLLINYVLSSPMVTIEETTIGIVQPFEQEECNQTSLLTMYYVPTNVSTEYIECISLGKGFRKHCKVGTVFCVEQAKCVSKMNTKEKMMETTTMMMNEATTMPVNKRMIVLDSMLETTTMMSDDNVTMIMQDNSTDMLWPNVMDFIPMVKTGENMTMNSTKSMEVTQTTTDKTMTTTTVNRNRKRHRYRHRNFNKRSSSLNRHDWIRVSIDVPNCMNTCHNGMCDEFSVTSKCICLVDFTGETCETSMEKHRDYKEMLENSFTMKHYLKNHYFENGTAKNMDVSMMNNSDVEIVSVNSLVAVKAGNTYERFWTELVDHLWSEILPEHHFMRNLTCDQFIESRIGTDLQRMFYYSKYIQENFKTRMEILEMVLVKMKSLLRERAALVKKDALSFLTEWKNFLVKTPEMRSIKQEMPVRKLSQKELMKEINDQIEKTFTLTRSLYEKYLTRQEEDIMENPEKLAELGKMFEAVKMSAMKSWNMVVEYGFWFLTYNLAVKDQSEKMAIDKMMRDNLDFFTRTHHEHHHHHETKQTQL